MLLDGGAFMDDGFGFFEQYSIKEEQWKSDSVITLDTTVQCSDSVEYGLWLCVSSDVLRGNGL